MWTHARFIVPLCVFNDSSHGGGTSKSKKTKEGNDLKTKELISEFSDINSIENLLRMGIHLKIIIDYNIGMH
jgi:hypothetical protein